MTISTHAHKENRPNDTLVPEYLHSLVPNSVGDRAGYVLRNAGKLDTVKTRLVASYISFIPKTTREWNSLMSTDNTYNSNIQKAMAIESFKACYKREFFWTPNPLYKIENEYGNIHQTRLRLGLSHLRAHLFKHNLIDDPTCQFCSLEPETTSHYILRCPTYNRVRVRFLIGLTGLLDHTYITSLNDDKIVQIFLHGDPDLTFEINSNIISMAQSFIVDSERFDLRVLR